MVTKPSMALSPSPNHGGARTPSAVVHHITDGLMPGCLNWLCSPASDASSNYLITKRGVIHELVPPGLKPWTNGPYNSPDQSNPFIARIMATTRDFNAATLTIEHEGRKGDVPTDAQLRASIHLTAWLCQEYRITPDMAHIFGHASIDAKNRPYCPGLAWPFAHIRESVELMIEGKDSPEYNERSALLDWAEEHGIPGDTLLAEGELLFDHGAERMALYQQRGVAHRYKGGSHFALWENPFDQSNPLTFQALERAGKVRWLR